MVNFTTDNRDHNFLKCTFAKQQQKKSKNQLYRALSNNKSIVLTVLRSAEKVMPMMGIKPGKSTEQAKYQQTDICQRNYP